MVSLKLFFNSLPLDFQASYQLVKLGYQDNSSNGKKCFSYLHLEMKVNIQIVGSENYQSFLSFFQQMSSSLGFFRTRLKSKQKSPQKPSTIKTKKVTISIPWGTLNVIILKLNINQITSLTLNTL